MACVELKMDCFPALLGEENDGSCDEMSSPLKIIEVFSLKTADATDDTWSHVASSSGEDCRALRVCKCQVDCNVGFTRMGNSYLHLHVYNRNTPYKCQNCITLSDCSEAVYKCDVCNAEYKTLGDLQLHRICHEWETDYDDKQIVMGNVLSTENVVGESNCEVGDPNFVIEQNETLDEFEQKESDCEVGDPDFKDDEGTIEQNETPYEFEEDHINEQYDTLMRQDVILQEDGDFCIAKFTKVDGLDMHKCTHCRAAFPSKISLVEHMKTHTPLKTTYNCDECKETFKFELSYIHHKRFMHSSYMPYKCGACEERFKKSMHLDNHMRVHATNKPFACQLCDMKFTIDQDLKLHLRKHKGRSMKEGSNRSKKKGSNRKK